MKYELPNLESRVFIDKEKPESDSTRTTFEVMNVETQELYGPEFQSQEESDQYGMFLITQLLTLQKGMWLMQCEIATYNSEAVDAQLMAIHYNWKTLNPACKNDLRSIMNTMYSFPLDYENMELWLQLKSEYLEFVA